MISRSQMRRQLRANGGIMNARQGYGLGSWVKEKIRKLIPNELAEVAVKAAPFVAPFNPAIAGLMSGVGSFDKTGRVGDSLKKGAMNYAGGQAARYLGGADFQGNPFEGGGAFRGGLEGLKGGFSSPLGTDTGFKLGTEATPSTTSEGNLNALAEGQTGAKETSEILSNAKNKPTNFKDVFQNKVSKFSSGLFEGVPILGELPPLVQQQILVGGATSAATYIYEAFIMEEPPQDENETMEEYRARRKENVGKKMRTYMDNYMAFDAEYSALDDAGKDAVVERYNKNMGGLMRQNYQTGGITMSNSLAQNIAQNKANQRARAQELEQARSRIPGYVAAEIVSAPRPIGGGGSGITTLPDGTPYNPGRPTVPLLESGLGENPRPINPGPSKPQTLPDGTPYDPGFPAPGAGGQPGSGIGGSLTPLLPMPRPGPAIDPNNPLQQLENSIIGNPNAVGGDVVDLEKLYPNPPKKLNPIMDPRGLTPEMLEAMEDGTFEEKFMGPPDNNDQSGGQQSTILPGSEDIMSGFEEFYKENYGMGTPSTADVRTYKLPNGEIVQGSSTSMGQTNAYLKSIGQPPATDVNLSSAGLSGLQQNPGGLMRTGLADGTNEDFQKYLKGRKKFESEMNLEQLYKEYLEDKRRQKISKQKTMAADGGLMRLGYMIGGEAKQMEAGAPPIMYSGNMDPNAPNEQAGLPSIPGPIQMAEDGPEFDMRENGGFQPLGRQEGKDDVPAILAKNEFVMTADAVRAAGGGSIQKGAQKMYDTMKKLESRVS